MKNFWEKLKKPIIALAPMCGITDLPFRLICRKYGADVVYTEMIMVQALAHRGEKTMRLTQISDKERPVVVQLGGKEPELFYKAAKVVAEEIKPDGIDINFGCPAKKVAGHGSGVALLRDLNLSYEIVQAVIEGSGGLPISIKTRTKIKSKNKDKTITSLDFLDKIKDLNVSAVMIHGRSFEAPWVEDVDYDFIKEAGNHFDGILLANGGINEPKKAKEVLDYTKADGIGIGHGVYGRPEIFKQIKNYLKKDSFDELTWPEKRKIAIEHAKLAYKIKGDHGLVELRKQLLWYVKGLPNAADYRSKLVTLKTVDEIIDVLININE